MPTDTRLVDQIAQLDPQPSLTLSSTDERGRDALLRTLLDSEPTGMGAARRRTAHRTARSVLAGLLVATAATTACLLAVSATGQAPHSDFALGASGMLVGWSSTAHLAEPTEADVDACMRLAVPAGDSADPATVITSEVRGRFRTLFLSIGARQGYCILSGTEAVWMPGGSFVSDDLLDPAPSANAVTTDWNGISDENANVGLIVTAHGRAGEDVTAVTLTLPDGTRVEASVANGSWSAWWPTSGDPTNGTQLATMLNSVVDFTTSDGVSHRADPSLHSAGESARQIQVATTGN